VDSRPASLDVQDALPSEIGSGSGHQTAFKLGEESICLSPVVNDGHQDGAVLSE